MNEYSRELRDAARQSRLDRKAAVYRDRADLYRADAAFKRSHGADRAADRLESLADNNARAAARLTG